MDNTYIASSSLFLLFQRKMKNVFHGCVNNASDPYAPVAHVDAAESWLALNARVHQPRAGSSLFSPLPPTIVLINAIIATELTKNLPTSLDRLASVSSTYPGRCGSTLSTVARRFSSKRRLFRPYPFLYDKSTIDWQQGNGGKREFSRREPRVVARAGRKHSRG